LDSEQPHPDTLDIVIDSCMGLVAMVAIGIFYFAWEPPSIPLALVSVLVMLIAVTPCIRRLRPSIRHGFAWTYYTITSFRRDRSR
jgi:hypothetical protein